MNPKIYVIKKSNEDMLNISNIAKEYKVTEDVASFFYYRDYNIKDYLINGINEITQEINNYCNNFNQDELVKNFIQIIKNSKKVLVYSDYDADGITSNTIFTKFLNYIKPYINNDIEIHSIAGDRLEGYGIKQNTIDEVIKDYKFDTIVTLDHGINDVDNVLGKLKNNNIKVITIDHHISENINNNTFDILMKPFDENISAGGLTFLFSYMISKKLLNEDNLQYITSLSKYACISQITDSVNFNKINYLIAKLGYYYLNNKNINFEESNLSLYRNKIITSNDIKFYIGPLLNAASRVSDANIALNFLLESNQERAKQYLDVLLNLNQTRKELQNSISNKLLNNKNCIDLFLKNNLITLLIDSDNIKESEIPVYKGIIGSLASQFTSQFNLPSIIMIKTPTGISGSCRGTEQFPIYPLIQEYREKGYIQGGGHKYAAGLHSSNNEIVLKMINEISERTAKEKIEKLYRIIEIEKSPSEIDDETYQTFMNLEPYGKNFDPPTFGFVSKIQSLVQTKNKKTYILNLENSHKSKFILYNNASFNPTYHYINKREIALCYNLNIDKQESTFIRDISQEFSYNYLSYVKHLFKKQQEKFELAL